MSCYLNLRSFFSTLLGAALCFSGACFAEMAANPLLESTQASQTVDFNIKGSSDVEMAIGPGNQYSQNQLAFTFDASQQSNATGTFKAYVTFPNRMQYALLGNIGYGSSPVTLEVGPPSLLGTYVLTFVITSLSGTINAAQGPFGYAQNFTNGDQLTTTFHVVNSGDQASATFINRLP